VHGRYVEFSVRAADFAVLNWGFTGTAGPSDLTGGRRTIVFASKVPSLPAPLTGAVTVSLSGTNATLRRAGAGESVTLQAVDCATGGIFQMEPERANGAATTITHTLAAGSFYFDNPNFRAREGDVVPYKDTTVTVTPRVNIASDARPQLVGRDSPQAATRVNQPQCANAIRKRDGTVATVQHCGGVSVWSVRSGGRMGAVMGEDSTEVSPPSPDCTQKCQVQDQVRGRSVVLGFPSPVPAASRLQPRS
jgi:hypothetical protein